jgi:hypothetical protein
MWHHNVDLLAYHDLDGRSGFKLALQEADGRFFLYIAGFWHSGWSILDVTDPEHPELLRWLDGPPNTMTIQVQVADGTMITALEHPPPGLTIGDPAAAWRPTTGTSTSPTSVPACRSTTSATPTIPASPDSSSPTTPRSAAGRLPPSSSTRPRTSWSTAAA